MQGLGARQDGLLADQGGMRQNTAVLENPIGYEESLSKPGPTFHD
jgi:hypothetical protein